MYFGEAQTVLDEKGRLTVPRHFRQTMDVLSHVVWYMTRGFDHSIFLFPQPAWETIREQASRFPAMNAEAADFRRLFFASVARSQLDRQGRVSIPCHLREYARVDHDVALIGVDDHLELWSREAWRSFQESKEAEFRRMATQLFAGEQAVGRNNEGGRPNHGD